MFLYVQVFEFYHFLQQQILKMCCLHLPIVRVVFESSQNLHLAADMRDVTAIIQTQYQISLVVNVVENSV